MLVTIKRMLQNHIQESGISSGELSSEAHTSGTYCPVTCLSLFFLIYFLISFTFLCLSRTYPSHTSLQGIARDFDGPVARAHRIDSWGWPGLTRYNDLSYLFSFVFYLIFKNTLFCVSWTNPSHNPAGFSLFSTWSLAEGDQMRNLLVPKI